MRIRWDELIARKGREEGYRERDGWLPGRRWEVNIKIHHNETGREDVDWINLAWVGIRGWGVLSRVP